MILYLKWLHICFMVTWFAGLFYLPRLFVYHAMSKDEVSNERFKTMERKLFYGIMTPGGILTIFFGIWLWSITGFAGLWINLKLCLVLVLVIYHFMCGKYVKDFKHDNNKHGHVFYRWFNEFPVLILFAAVYLVVFKPI